MATEILFNLIKTYVGPIMQMADLHVCPDGIIRNSQNGEIKYSNPKYQEGDVDKSEIIYPIVPVSDELYLEMKERNDCELFNPFINFKHMATLAVKLKKALVPFCISKEKLNAALDEDDYDQFDEFINLFNNTEPSGMIKIGFSNNEDPASPKEVISYVAEDIVKATWGLCIQTLKYLDPHYETVPEFKNIDRSWKHIQKVLVDWDKCKKTIIKNVKEDMKSGFSVESMDLSDSTESPEGVFSIKEYDDSDYVFDMNDTNNTDLQGYLTSLFDQDSLTPYVEPEESEPEPVVVQETPETAPIVEAITPNEQEVEKSSNDTGSGISISVNKNHANQPCMQMTQSSPMGMNPMMGGMYGMSMGGMNPMMGMMGNTFMPQGMMSPMGYPQSDINQMDLSDSPSMF